MRVKVYCPSCGIAMDVSEREANAERPPCCSEQCESDFANDNPAPWRPDPVYRGQYDYASGYHD